MSDVHNHVRNEHWYMYEAETAGTRDAPKVIVHEVAFRTRSMLPEESAHILIDGPQVSRLFKFLLNNLGVLRLKAILMGFKGGKGRG